MKFLRALAAAALLALAPVAHADERGWAITGQAADVGTTAYGLAHGFTEANPLGAGLLVGKVAMGVYITKLPELEQPKAWSVYGAVGWGAAAHNVCYIVGGPLCLAVGAAVGYAYWLERLPNVMREEFFVLCGTAKKDNPELQCVYTEPV